MSRREQREQIFKILFGVRISQCGGTGGTDWTVHGRIWETFVRKKLTIFDRIRYAALWSIWMRSTDSSSTMLHPKTGRQPVWRKQSFQFCVLLPTRLSMKMIFRCLFPLMRQLNWQNYTDHDQRTGIRKRNFIRNGMKQRNVYSVGQINTYIQQYVCSGFYDESCCGTWGSV